MRRVCPRCECLSPSTAEFCAACGYRIVAFLAAPAATKVAPPARRRELVLPPPLRHCVYCGGIAVRGTACRVHRDLPALDAPQVRYVLP